MESKGYNYGYNAGGWLASMKEHLADDHDMDLSSLVPFLGTSKSNVLLPAVT